PMQYKGCFPGVNAEVAKSDIFATCNPLKSQGRSRLIVLVSKLRATTLKLWPGHQPIMQEFRRLTSDQTGQPNPVARCIISAYPRATSCLGPFWTPVSRACGASLLPASKNQHTCRHTDAYPAFPVTARGRRGIRTVNSVKSPTSLSTVMLPPCCWVM